MKTLLSGDRLHLLDGSMGVLLQQRGLRLGEHPESFNLTRPDIVREIHREYLEAGAEAIYTNTFGASRRKLAGTGYEPEEVIRAAVALAKDAAAPYGGLVGLDLGPLGELLEPMGTLSFEEAYELFAEQVRVGAAAGADFCVIETMTDLSELRAALLAVRENCTLPVLCSMSFEAGGRTFTGCDVRSFALTAQGLGADALGINCSLGPVEILPIARELTAWTTLPVFVKANAGLPEEREGETVFPIGPEEFARAMEPYLELGVVLMGGCCGTTPETIRALGRLRTLPLGERTGEIPAAVCTATRVVPIDRVRVIGERINPTGKPLLKEALRTGNMTYAVQQAMEQAEAGAEILDINAGLPDIDQAKTMVQLVRAVQDAVDLPLQIDATDPAVIEGALRACTGKAIVNSVSGEDAVLDRILPLVRRYGAAVVGLTLDEHGIPETAEARLAIAKKIVERAEAYGIPRRDVFIDCLTLTVSAKEDNALETLRAVSLVKKELGVRTLLGVSNISFGLPGREVLNQAFLLQALTAGLDLPILNPNSRPMMDAAAAFRVLRGQDPACEGYIRRFAQAEPAAPKQEEPCCDLEAAVRKGLREQAQAECAALLREREPLAIVEEVLIPILDRVGRDYEEGKIFLPQLIQSAEAAKRAFEAVRSALKEDAQEAVCPGRIAVATVQGDIHDIGKNIVKVVLENYGYQVVDLGRDVPAARVAEAVREQQIPLVGLSALMTTTVRSMEETIRLLRLENPECKILVGGAVLTPDYARRIGADYYARDAQQSAAIAREVFGR